MKWTETLAPAALCSFTIACALAKLPPLTDEQQATPEETKAVAAAVAKKDAESLANAQDRVARRYMQEHKAKSVTNLALARTA